MCGERLIMNIELYDLSKRVGQILKEKGLFIATAESCTGGLLAATFTDVPGSSAYFDRGFITYSNAAKQEVLGVRLETLKEFDAVSEQVAREMVTGALKNSHAQVGIAITGVAGPDGGTKNKPVGHVCIAWGGSKIPIKVITQHFSGDREAVRKQSVKAALENLLHDI